MRNIARRVYGHPNYERVIEWTKLISITGSAQIMIQGIGFLSGILVVRLLSTQEYAIYTLANTMLGTMIILGDGGVTNGIMAQGGKVWQDKARLGRVLATGFDLRRKLALASFLVLVPILVYLLFRHHASWLSIGLIVASLIPAFFSSLSGSILQIALSLNQDIRSMQANQLFISAGRLLLVAGFLFLFPWAFIAILASGLPQAWGNWRLRKLISPYVDQPSVPDPVIRKQVLNFVRRVFPGALYYCLSGQITIWMISAFGSTTAVAQVGALGRLAMILTVFTSIFTTLIVPRFSRLPSDKTILVRRYLQILGGLILFSFCIVGVVTLFPTQLLWVLGKGYASLDRELVYSIIASCLALLAGCSFTLCSSRSWALNPVISISLSLAAIITGILILDVSTIKGVLFFNMFILSVEVIMYFIYFLVKTSRIHHEQESNT